MTKRITKTQVRCGEARIPSLLPEGWAKKLRPHEKQSTGVGFISDLMDGGQTTGQVHGVLAGMGVGKTTLAVQLCAQAALRSWANWPRRGKPGPRSFAYLAFYEGTINEMRCRALSHLAQVDRSTLEQELESRNLAKQSHDSRFTAFEKDRLRTAIDVLNHAWRPIDMTECGSSEPRHQGDGIVDQIARVIREDQDQLRATGIDPRVSMIAVDQVSAAVARHRMARNLRPGPWSGRLVRGFPGQAAKLLSKPFSCPVWLFHQLDGNANGCEPANVPGVASAEDSPEFAADLDFCFVIGNKTKEERAIMVLGKGARFPARRSTIVRVDGALATVRDVAGQYSVQPLTSAAS